MHMVDIVKGQSNLAKGDNTLL